MAREPLFVVVAYDVTDDRRRAKVHAILKDYGQRVQYSVFECRITPEQLFRLQAALTEVIQTDQGDQIRFYLLCTQDTRRVRRIGGPEPWPETVFWT